MTTKKTSTQLSVRSVRHWPSLIIFLSLCNAVSRPLSSLCSPANCRFRCLSLSASDLWGKCSPLCLLHLVAFVLKISILWQVSRAFTLCILVHHVEYKQCTILPEGQMRLSTKCLVLQKREFGAVLNKISSSWRLFKVACGGSSPSLW